MSIITNMNILLVCNNMLNKLKHFVFEDGYNTSYIDTLMISLFYSPSHIENMLLNCDPEKTEFVYFQELIRTKIIEPIRKNLTIYSSTINEIRNYAHILGWKDINYILDNHTVSEFYKFLIDNFNCCHIEIIHQVHSKNKESKDSIENKEIIPFIEFDLLEENSMTNTSIKVLLEAWFQHKIKKSKKYKTIIINSIPIIVVFSIKRNQKNKTKIDIQKAIRLKNTKESNYLLWGIHAVICKKENHYYSLIKHVDKWYLFNNKLIPSMIEVNMSDKTFVETIQTECVFIIYNLLL